MRALVAALGLVLLGALASGCGGDDEPAAAPAATVPAGLRATSTPAFAVAFPSGWTATSGRAGTVAGEVRTIAEGPAGSTGIRPGAVVGATPGAGADAATLAAANAADTRVRSPTARISSPREATVSGARSARIIESRVAAVPTGDGRSRAVAPGTPGSVVVHQWDVVAQSATGAAVNLYLYVPEPDASRVPVQDIIRSLTVR